MQILQLVTAAAISSIVGGLISLFIIKGFFEKKMLAAEESAKAKKNAEKKLFKLDKEYKKAMTDFCKRLNHGIVQLQNDLGKMYWNGESKYQEGLQEVLAVQSKLDNFYLDILTNTMLDGEGE